MPTSRPSFGIGVFHCASLSGAANAAKASIPCSRRRARVSASVLVVVPRGVSMVLVVCVLVITGSL